MAALSRKKIQDMGFAQVGENVMLSERASFYNCEKISIADNVRIDDFCVLSAGSGGIDIGSYVHIGVGTSMIGGGKISFGDYSGASSKVSIYSSNDDYSGNYMIGPQVPIEYTNVTCSDVWIGKHVIIGSGAVILPGVEIEDGVAVGALSLVTRNLKSFCVYSGVPAKKISSRQQGCLKQEQLFIARHRR